MVGVDEELKVLLEVLRGGVAIEERGFEFYMKAARKVDDEYLAKTLTFLAGEEKKHEAFIKAIIESVKSDAKVPDDISFESGIPGGMPKVFPEMEEYAAKVAAAQPGRKDPKLGKICEEALKIEDKSIEYYEASKKKASSWGSARVFDILIAEENKHKQLIELQRDYLDVHGFFFDIGLEKHFALD